MGSHSPAPSTAGAVLPGSTRPGRLAAALLTAAVLSLGPAAARAGGWKACAFNDRPIGCRDHHSPDGSVRVEWQDGVAMTYRMVQSGSGTDLMVDSLGGRWRRQLYPQGNVVLTNPANGNTVFIPLR